MNIKLLEPERYPELLKFEQFQGIAPNPATSLVAVAEDDHGVVKGFWMAQAVVHVEPVLLTEECQDGGLTATRLLALLLAELSARGEASFYAFAESESVVNYLLRLGLTPLPYAIFLGINPNLLTAKE